jgi:hypothetical protein
VLDAFDEQRLGLGIGLFVEAEAGAETGGIAAAEQFEQPGSDIVEALGFLDRRRHLGRHGRL